jgi:anti-anti-sigma factor
MAGDVIHDDGVLRIVRLMRPAGLALAGEIDESTYPALMAALNGAAGPNSQKEFHLDLTELEFCDAAGLHAMIRLVDRLDDGGERGGGRVVLHAPSAALRSMLRIVGWDELPELIVEDR